VRRVGLVALAACALLGLPRVVAAADATSNAFLPSSGGPRVAAMGGHLIALVSDDHAIDVNPGRLPYAGRVVSAQFDRIDPDLDLWRGRVGVAFGAGDPLADAFRPQRPSAAAFGFALDGMNLTLIEGSAYREMAVAGGAALCLTNFSAIGLTARYQRATTDVLGANASGYGVDFGIAVNLSDYWDAGIAIKNAFGRSQFEDSDDEDHAARLTLGVATSNRKRWQAEFDYVFQYDHNAAAALGGEYHVLPGSLDLRAGVSREMLAPARTIVTAGAGFTYRQFQIDYAYGNDADGAFEQQHRVALSARF
jgi:hypothetical protein